MLRHLLPLSFLPLALTGPVASAQTLPAQPSPPLSPQSSVLSTQSSPTPQYWLGVAVESIPPTIGRLLKLPPGQGLLIAKVIPHSPADAAHLQAGDLLITLNDQPLTSQQQLVQAINPAPDASLKTSPVTLELIRDGERHSLQLTPAPRPPEMVAAGAPLPPLGQFAANPRGQNPNTPPILVGPGYIIDLNAANPNYSLKSIRAFVSQGQTIILSQETDSRGTLRNSVTVGTKTYDLDPAHLDQLPADIRELVTPLLSPPRVTSPATSSATRPQAVLSAPSLQEQLRLQQQQIDTLTRQLNELQRTQPSPGRGE